MRTRAWPLAARWAATAAIVAVAWGIRFLTYGATAEEPFLLFFPAIILAAMFFGRDSGLLATALSALLATYFFILPVYSFGIERTADIFNLAIFGVVGLFLSALIEALQRAYRAVEQAAEREAGARQQAEASERERALVLAQLRHRVKNDLARVSAMLHIQANAASGETAQALREAAERINLMARLYGRLGRQDGHAMVDAAVLLGDLLADLREGMDQLQPVGLFLEAEPLQLPVARAGSLGLVMNELVVRALKHAFPDGEREGTVKIALRRDGSEALLTVEDNGRGIAPASDSRGDIRLIRALAAQLGGHIESESAEGGGARCCLRFPVDAGSTAAPMPEPERALASISQAAS